MTGTGTSLDPYLISTSSDLNSVANNLSAYYKQTADIDMGGVSFTPIGNATTAFTGTFDGDNHIISNLSITSSSDNTGLFGYVVAGTLQNIKLYTVTINSTKAYVGSLVGQVLNNGSINSTVINCGASAVTLTAVDHIGGLFGNLGSNATKCFVTGLNLTGTGIMLGGIAGVAAVSLPTQVNISQCFAEGLIDGTGQTFVGGFSGMVGGNYLIENCYIKCNIKGNMYVGGFSGFTGGASYKTYMHKCYTASPMIVTTTNVGAFNGEMGSTVEIINCFYDKTISVVTTDKSNANSGLVTGKTTAEMQTQSTYTNYDFTNIWQITTNEYPHFQYYQVINPTSPVTLSYNQNYHNLSSPLFGVFSPLF